MTYTDVWLAELATGAEPLPWPTWRTDGTPQLRSISPALPPAPGGTYKPFSTIRNRIQHGVYQGQQLDWGAWGAIVTRQEITDLLDEVYGTNPTFCTLEHLCLRLAEVRAVVHSLPMDKKFALIAEEF